MAHTWLHNFESALQRLETDAAGDAALTELLRLSESCLDIVADSEAVQIWLLRPASAELLAPEQATDSIDSQLAAKLREVATSDHLIYETASTDEATRQTALFAAPLATQLACVLQADYETLKVPPQSFIDAGRAIVEVLGRSVGQKLLSQSENRLRQQMALSKLTTQLTQATSLQDAAELVVQHGTLVLDACRLSVLTNDSGRWKIQAATGVRQVNRDSEMVRTIESLAESDDFIQWSPAPDLLSYSPDVAAPQFRMLKLQPATAEPDSQLRLAVSIELLRGQTPPDEALLQQFAESVANTLHPWCQSPSVFEKGILRHRAVRCLSVAGLLVAALAFIPADFEIEVPGQVTSTNRQRIFAPQNGTITEVLFENESDVSAGQIILRMSNADLELEQRRLQGERDTATAELAAVRTQRISNSDPELSGTEQRLEQRLKNLTEQLTLLTSQILSLTVEAPFNGTAYRNDPVGDLLSRPVQRGQLLLEVVPADTQWQLDLTIPDHLAVYVRERMNSEASMPQIRYIVKSNPDENRTTNLSAMDDAFQVVDGEIVCRATAELTQLSDAELRSGSSVVAKIHCGRRSLGFVWFRELIEFWQQARFAWF